MKDRGNKSNKSERTDKTDRGNRGNKSDKSDKTDKTDRGNKSDKSERTDKTDRGNKSDRTDKTDKSDRTDKSDNLKFNSMLKKITIIIAICFFAVIAANVNFAKAGLYENASRFSESAGFGELDKVKSPAVIIAGIIQWFLFLLGVIFVILIIYGGYLWLTAGGNNEQVDTAKKRIISAIIGLIIILAAYAITYYVLEKLIEASVGRQQIG